MIKRIIVCLAGVLYGLCAGVAYADICDTVPHKKSSKMLDEVTVSASYLTRKDDHLLAVPTKEQRHHAVTGYDLLSNLMIPGVIVDRSNGEVNTPSGAASIYIEGREASFKEVRSLRPRDIAKVEYYDLPTGKYAKDVAAINFVLKELNSGGYTQFDALQGIGFTNGDYNIISKYISGNRSFNLWTGYNLRNPKSSFSMEESFDFPSELDRFKAYDNLSDRREEEYCQASLSNRGRSMMWMIRGGASLNKRRQAVADGTIDYTQLSANSKRLSFTDKDHSFRPSLYFYGMNSFSKTLSLEYVADGYYSRNRHERLYREDTESYGNDVEEDYYYLKLNANLIKTLSHNNRLSFVVYEFFRMSDSDYKGEPAFEQNLRSSESILFADYSQRAGRFFYDINPGVSFLTYRLEGMSSISRLSPRLQLRGAFIAGRKQQIQFIMSLGNTYPMIQTINRVEQILDPIIILRGNAGMDNSTLLNTRLNYTLNANKLSLQAGLSYFYQNHAITTRYSIEDTKLISSFCDDARFHKPGIDLSITYKPDSHLNMNLTGAWNSSIVNGQAPNKRLSYCHVSAGMNYYIDGFAFGLYVKTPEKTLVNYQIKRKTDWQYRLRAMWNHGNLGVEMEAYNIFSNNNMVSDQFCSEAYSFRSKDIDRRYNRYATLKIAYSFDYGKKTQKTPAYQHMESESAILK